MEKNYSKIIKILKMISIINIVAIIIAYILPEKLANSINMTASLPGPRSLKICALGVFFLQIINIVLLQIQTKKEYSNKIKKTIIIVIILIIITIFIPVKRQSSITYIQPDRDKNIFSPEGMGKTIYKYKFKNIYSITLKTQEKITAGIDIY